LVVIDKENILTVVAPLGNMMRDIRDHNACCSWHNIAEYEKNEEMSTNK